MESSVVGLEHFEVAVALEATCGRWVGAYDLGRFAHGMHHTPHTVGYLAGDPPGVYFVEYYGRLFQPCAKYLF